ncbi:hypothetical protein PACTADRAFT_50850, partial [Pachysolen tannophilus NRRL Y-2460]
MASVVETSVNGKDPSLGKHHDFNDSVNESLDTSTTTNTLGTQKENGGISLGAGDAAVDSNGASSNGASTASGTNSGTNGAGAANGAGSAATKKPEVKIIRRKLNGYVGFANLPKQWHRKSIRRGFNLNIMVVGESGLGKSTLINTLFNRDLYSHRAQNDGSLSLGQKELTSTTSSGNFSGLITNDVTIESVSTDIEENGIKLHLTVLDTVGFGDAINNEDSWKPIVEDIENRFNTYLEAENKINRQTIADNRVHALLYFIEPTGHSLKPLDIKFMKEIHEKVNLIPIIAKSDILTEEEIYEFKQRIMDDINNQGINIFKPPQYENDDDETILNTQEIMSKVPFAVVGSIDEIQTKDGRSVRGRNYPWGIIEVDNENHCDFIKLRQLLIRNYMEELKETTSKYLFENYRTEKLKKLGIQQDNSVFREFDPSSRQEEEKILHEAKLAKMEADLKTIFQTKVSAKEKKLQSQESELFSKH